MWELSANVALEDWYHALAAQSETQIHHQAKGHPGDS